WGNDTITIKGTNTGINHLTVLYDGEKLPISDFLNNSLMAEYASIYETIMSKYEAKLKSGNILDHNFPETATPCKKIDASQYQSDSSLPDQEHIEALLKEYHTCLDYIKDHFKQYEDHVERWFNRIPSDTKRV
ncbi:MAG: hypothetical protein LBR10_13770, partial [Prevotellaceae bacterium]|nr:hypothetical protein [Prevotellaceae bacterium]